MTDLVIFLVIGIIGVIVGYLLHGIVMKFSSTLTLPEKFDELINEQIKVINEGNSRNFEMVEEIREILDNLDYSNSDKLKEEIEKIKIILRYNAV